MRSRIGGRSKWVWTSGRRGQVALKSFLVLALVIAGGTRVVWAQAPLMPVSAMVAAGAESDVASVRLMVGRSTVLDVGTTIARVSLTSADIADALVTSSHQLLINGKTPGTISMFVWDRSGAIRRYEVIVQRDLARLSEQMRQLFPNENIQVQSNGKNVVLSGTVTNKDLIEKAVNVASGYVDKREEVVTLLQLQAGAPTNQVLLRVRFAEVSRSALSELGASFFTSPTGVKNTLGRSTTQQFGAPGFTDLAWSKESSDFGSDVTSSAGKLTFSDMLNLFFFSQKYDLGMMVRALQDKGLFQSLAEPNLVAESGKEASFLAGGEFPIPVAQGSGNNASISVMFKEFGIRLNFTPTVNGDRVHLKVRPEVSSLDFNNAVVLQGFRIPALITRRTETELELANGQTFAIAGLMNNTLTTQMQKIPGIGDIPILGLLFKSKAAQRNQTELVVMITPVILPNNSRGVTPNLPKVVEPFMPPAANRTIDMPPPAFGGAQAGSTNAMVDQATVVPTPARTPAPAPSAGSAAAALSALTPSAPKIADPAPVAPEAAEAASAPAATRPLTGKEKKAIEQARREEAVRAQARAKADQHAREIEAERSAVEQAKRQEQARAQAKRDAEAARRAQAAAKKQAALDRENKKAMDAAAARLKAAEARYNAELAKHSQQ
jgi:pilus assembly protein CpaC